MKSTTIVIVAKHLNKQPDEIESDDPTTQRIRLLSLQLLNPDHDRDYDHLQLAKLKSTTIVTIDSMMKWDSLASKLLRSHWRFFNNKITIIITDFYVFIFCKICMLNCCLSHCLHHQCQEWVEVSLHHHRWVGWGCLQCHLMACHPWVHTDIWFVEHKRENSYIV